MGYGTSALGACGTFAQILVFLVNTVLFAGSVLLVTGSVLLLKEDNSIVQFIDVNNPNQVAYIGICLGSVTAFITFFGCGGACSQSKKIIRLYLVMLVILFILFLTIIILGTVYQKSLRGNLTNGMKRSLNEIERNSNANETEKLETYWHNMQEQVECCGLTGWEDWKFKSEVDQISIKENQGHEGRNLPQGETTDHSQVDKTSTSTPTNAPQSDTRHKRDAKFPSTTNSLQQVTDQPEYISQEVLNRLHESCFSDGNRTIDKIYPEGCRDKAKEQLQLYVTIILVASGGVAFVLLFSICISCWLLKSVKKALAYNF